MSNETIKRSLEELLQYPVNQSLVELKKQLQTKAHLDPDLMRVILSFAQVTYFDMIKFYALTLSKMYEADHSLKSDLAILFAEMERSIRVEISIATDSFKEHLNAQKTQREPAAQSLASFGMQKG